MWENNIKMYVIEVGWQSVELGSFGSGYGQVMGCCDGGNEPSGVMKCGEFVDWARKY
jgi:hypothetical protein